MSRELTRRLAGRQSRGVRQIIADVVVYERRARAAQDLPTAEDEASSVGMNGRQASFIPA